MSRMFHHSKDLERELAPAIGDIIEDLTSNRSHEYFEVFAVALPLDGLASPVVYAVSARGSILAGPVVRHKDGRWDVLRVTSEFFEPEESGAAKQHFVRYASLD